MSPLTIKDITAQLSAPPAGLRIAGLKGSTPAWIVSRMLADASELMLVITPDGDAADEFHRELLFYSGCHEGIQLFPSWENAPYEHASPHPDVTGRRLNALFSMMNGSAKVVVAPAAALCQRVLSRSDLNGVSDYLLAGEEADREALLEKLVRLGYSHVPLVEDRGSFAARGGILDIFPPNLTAPVRIEFFGDFVETIRAFDPLTQRSLHPVEDLVLLPSREIILNNEVMQQLPPKLKKLCDTLDIPLPRRRELLEQLQNAIYPPGIEYLQPLFHPVLETLFDYAGATAIRVLTDPDAIDESLERFAGELELAEAKAQENEDIICERNALFLPGDEVRGGISAGTVLSMPALELHEPEVKSLALKSFGNTELRIATSPEGESLLKPLVDRITGWLDEQMRIIVVCSQKAQSQRLFDLLSPHGLPVALEEHRFPVVAERRDRRVSIMTGEISRGFRIHQENLVVVAEEEIFGPRSKRRGLTEARKKQILTSLAELKPGDHMVHLDFGVGLYRGLQHLTVGDVEGDFLLLEYAGSDRLYLPVDRLNLVQRYVGSDGVEPHLDKLGGAGWEKSKAKARAAVEEMAGELLKIYAERELKEGHAFSPPDEMYREFEASFAWDETPDQMAAIEDVLADMQSSKPMDRLVCGDVGYGKTEVAMRGAFKAVLDGKQVAVLVPTTILAQQHHETFTRRFADYPLTVGMLSRFRTPKEQKETLEKVKKGEVDVVIGTHRLLQADVQFKDLGLLIVDEEQRFGVAHKEKLKKYRATVDIMTLTATPIPRTLYMSMMGIRDLSIIDTPPVDRLAIKTFVARFSEELVREAVLREIRRGGQVFFVHNRVQSIGLMQEHLQRIVPEAKIAVGHGQMDEKELEKVMLGFMHGETNLLLCTTIIESGLDIPSANTLIINRADSFGLAQLYQLRGRVGRSRQRAYAYFMIPGEGSISQEARERLRIMQEITELGAGFRIATHDLEIRGAGDLLGGKQSGQIAAVGFELYTEMLEEAVNQMKGEDREIRIEPEMKLRIPAFIPEDYVPQPNLRLILYKKLTQAQSEDDVSDVAQEFVDRFGPLPPAVTFLLEVMNIRIMLKQRLIQEIEFDGSRLLLSFHPRTIVSPDIIIGLVRQQPKKYQFTPDFRLIAEISDRSFDGILAEARNLLKSLAHIC